MARKGLLFSFGETSLWLGHIPFCFYNGALFFMNTAFHLARSFHSGLFLHLHQIHGVEFAFAGPLFLLRLCVVFLVCLLYAQKWFSLLGIFDQF